MKKVVSKSEVAHLWANQLQSEANTPNSSFFFKMRAIYSYTYNFPIAVLDQDNPNICYFTTRGYSVTTSSHISLCQSASSHKTKIYCYNPLNASKGIHTENIQQFDKECKVIAQSLVNARKPEKYLNEIEHQRHMLETYCNHFNIDIEPLKQTLSYIWIESKDGGNVATENERKAIELQKAKQLKELKKRNKIEIVEFREFKRYNLHSRDGYDYLRFNRDNEEVQTSQGVKIPKSIALNLYKQILETIKSGECTICNTKFMNMYEITDVNKNFIQIGCHKITIKEIKLLVNSQGW